MIKTISQIFALLTPSERRQAFLLLGMILIMALLDTIGVASVMPFLAVLANPDIVADNKYLAFVYDRLGFNDESAFLFFLGVFLLVTVVVSVAFKAATTFAMLRYTQLRNYSLGKRLVGGYLHQPYAWFLNRHSADLSKTVLGEVHQVVTGALMPVLHVIAHGSVALFLLLLLIVVDPTLAVTVAAALGAVYALTYLSFRRFLNKIGVERFDANRERYKVLQEAFGAIKQVKVGRLEDEFTTRFDGPAKRFALRLADSQAVAQLPRFGLEILVFGGLLSLVLYLIAGAAPMERALPVLGVYTFAGYRLIPALQQVYSQFTSLRFSQPSLDALHDDLDHFASVPPRVRPPVRSRERQSEIGLRLTNITFTYPESDHPTLANVSLEICSNTMIGIVGSTGSGKTTLVDVILGLLQPQSGQMYVDGSIVTQDNIEDWQRSVGYVPQDIFLADDTVAANIAFGVPGSQIDEERVLRAAEAAQICDFIQQELPNQFGTLVGDRGIRLSGGQRQRIGIARALYRDPRILIFDEATSALDHVTEGEVMHAVGHEFSRRKTVIIVAHRLSTVRECDEIFLMEGGRIVSHGPFDTLVAESPSFRAMVGRDL